MLAYMLDAMGRENIEPSAVKGAQVRLPLIGRSFPSKMLDSSHIICGYAFRFAVEAFYFTLVDCNLETSRLQGPPVSQVSDEELYTYNLVFAAEQQRG